MMDKHLELTVIRRAYAKQILAAAGVTDPPLEDAFAHTRREFFLGPGPWPIFLFWAGTYRMSPDADPVYLYTNDLIGISPERKLNNGEPTFHAKLMAEAKPRPGEHVVHVGAGVGYYTAILAHLVGESGQVTGIEFEADLAARARDNFAGFPNVTIVHGDGNRLDFAPADVVYVNAGTTRPAERWLDQLKDGGRIILPLTTARGFSTSTSPTEISRQGAVFKIERRADEYLAAWISTVAVFPCAGARDPLEETALAEAFATGRVREVTRLYRGSVELPAERCWLRGSDWCLAYC